MTGLDVTSAAINFTALIFVGAQVLFARRAIREATASQQREWNRLRRQATIDLSVTTAPYREKLKSVLPWNDRDPAIVAQFLSGLGNDPVKMTPVRQYFNHLTDVAVGIKMDVYDLETLFLLEGSRIIDTAASFKPYIDTVRRELGRPSIYEDVEELAAMLKELRNGTP